MAISKLKVAAVVCIGIAAVGTGGAVLVAHATRPHNGGVTRSVVVPASAQSRRQGGAARGVPVAMAVRGNTQPAVPADVVKSADDLRRALIRFDLTSTHQSDQPLTPPDDARIDSFPNSAWPDVSGFVARPAASYRKVTPAAPYRKDAGQAGFIFDAQLADQLSGGRFQTLVFTQGVANEGAVAVDSYNTIFSRGDFRGTLDALSYATLIVEGDLAGKVVTQTWLNLAVTGRVSGSIIAPNGLTAYLMGGLDSAANVAVGQHAALYIGGSTPQAALAAIHGEEGTAVYLEASDLPAGEHVIGNLKVIVAEPRPDQSGNANRAK